MRIPTLPALLSMSLLGASALADVEEEARRILAPLGDPRGARVAEIGAGDGGRAFAVARLVGPEGHVVLEEIDAEMLDEWKASKPPDLENVGFVIGGVDDPELPEGDFDLVFMVAVFHHFTHPREMLAEIHRALRPGGFLVVVEPERGPPVDRAPFSERGDTHHPIGETTLARLAHEAHFRFHSEIDWPPESSSMNSFALAFRRVDAVQSRIERRWSPEQLGGLVPALDGGTLGVVVSRRARPALAAALARRGGDPRIVEIDLDERRLPGETLAAPATLGSWRTVRSFGGVPEEPLPRLDAVVFADAYRDLYYHDVLLSVLRERLAPGATVTILDRLLPDGLPRLVYGHRRGISPRTVTRELERAGFAITAQSEADGGLFVRAEPQTETAGRDPSESDERVRAILVEVSRGLELPGRGRLTLIGDDPVLTPDTLVRAGVPEVGHSTARGWSGYRGHAMDDPHTSDRWPYPWVPGERNASMVLVLGYEHHPEPRRLLDLSSDPLHDEGGLLVIETAREGRADGRPDTPDAIVAQQPALVFQHTVNGDPLGRPGRRFHVFRFHRAENRVRGLENEIAAIDERRARIESRLASAASSSARASELEAERSDLLDELERHRGYLENARKDLGLTADREELVGRAAPEIDFEWTAPGTPYGKLSELRGRVAIVSFWLALYLPQDGWSGDPGLRELADQYAEAPVEFLAVSRYMPVSLGGAGAPDREEAMARLAESLVEEPVPWHVAFARDAGYDSDYAVGSHYPYLVILDAEGRVRHAAAARDASIGERAARIDELLREAGHDPGGAGDGPRPER